MIWGMVLQPGVEYTRNVTMLEYITLASLDCRHGMNTGKNIPIAHVVLKSHNVEYILCTLEKGVINQQRLDYVLQEGDALTLKVEGTGVVYITGYTHQYPTVSDDKDDEIAPAIVTKEQPPRNSGSTASIEMDTVDTASIGEEEDQGKSRYQTEACKEKGPTATEGSVATLEKESIDTANMGEGSEKATYQADILEQIFLSATDEDFVSEDRNNKYNLGSAVTTRMKVETEEGLCQQLCREISPPTDGVIDDTCYNGTGKTTEGTPTPTKPSVKTMDQMQSNRVNYVTSNVLEGTINYASHVAVDTEQGSDQPLQSRNTPRTSNVTEGVLDSIDTNRETTETSNIDMETKEHSQSNMKNPVQTESIIEGTIHCDGTNAQPAETSALNWELEGYRQGNWGSTFMTDGVNNYDGIPCIAQDNISAVQVETEGSQELSMESTEESSEHIGSQSVQIVKTLSYETPGDKSKNAFVNPTFNNETISEGSSDDMIGGTMENAVNLKAMKSSNVQIDISPHHTSKKTKRCIVLLEKIDKPFKCQLCKKRFHAGRDLKAHRKIHCGKKSVKFDYWEKRLNHKADLKTYGRIHNSQKPFRCEHCNKKFSRKAYLKQHEKIHIKKKPLTCEHCKKKFKRELTFKRHERIHTGEKPFTCEHCDKKFRRKAHMKRHESIHTGEKPFTCEHCDKKFSRKESLKQHEMIHTGEKPFLCELCGKKFRQRSCLKQHEKIHAREKVSTFSHCEL